MMPLHLAGRWLLRRGFWAFKWFAYEFLWIGRGYDLSSVCATASRILGLAVIIGIIRWVIVRDGQTGVAAGWPAYVPTGLLAVLIGNIAKECAMSLCAGALGWFDCDFSRRGATFDGKKYLETFYSDGTWIRCEWGPEGSVCEWTDAYGHCNRIVTARPKPTRR